MSERIAIRSACEADADFVAGVVSSLLEFGSPAWTDSQALAPRFAEVLASALRTEDSRSTVLIAQTTNGTRLGFNERARGFYETLGYSAESLCQPVRRFPAGTSRRPGTVGPNPTAPST